VPTSEGTSPATTQRAGSRLPESVLASLREAFAEEVSQRLPRLRSAAATLEPTALRDALRDVHSLGSSAYVVGEDEAARAALAAEAVLIDGGPLVTFVDLVATLDRLLSVWVR